MSYKSLSSLRLLKFLPALPPHHSPTQTLLIRNLSLSQNVFTPCVTKLSLTPHHCSLTLNNFFSTHPTNLCAQTEASSEPTQPDLEKVVELLSVDLAKVFIKKINIPLYHPEMVFEDKIRGNYYDNVYVVKYKCNYVTQDKPSMDCYSTSKTCTY